MDNLILAGLDVGYIATIAHHLTLATAVTRWLGQAHQPLLVLDGSFFTRHTDTPFELCVQLTRIVTLSRDYRISFHRQTAPRNVLFQNFIDN